MKVDNVNYSEAVIRNKAAVKAEQDSHYNKRNNLLKVAVCTAPVVEGISAMINSPKLTVDNTAILNSERFGQNILEHANNKLPYIKGAAARSLNGLKAGGSLAAYLAAGLLVSEASVKLAQKNEKYAQFRQNYDLVNWLGVAAGAIALVVGAKRGAGAIMDKLKPETVEKMFNTMTKHGDAFNNNRLVKAISNGYNNLAARLSEGTQQTLKTIASYASTAVILGSAVGIAANRINFENKFRANYTELKEQQLAAAAADVAKAS